jgi:general secretion pathway protein I
MSGRSTRRSAGGFTLLEVMVALAILAGALVLISRGVAQSVRQANHARQTRTAALLMRMKMADVEADLYKNGFSDFPEEDGGNFGEQGFPSFRWIMRAEKVELPTNLGQAAADASKKLSDATNAVANSSGANTAALAQATDSSMMSTLLSQFGGVVDQVKMAMEDSVRRVTVRIVWYEPPREEKMEVAAYYVDTTRLAIGTGGGVDIPGGAGRTVGSGLGSVGGIGSGGSSSGSGNTTGTTGARQ